MSKYIFATLTNHPLAKSIRKGLRAKGHRLIDLDEILERLKKNLNYPDTVDFHGILLPAAENPDHYRWLQVLFRCEIVTELDLAQSLTKNPIIAISGTDGKTSTTEMIAKGLKACGKDVDLFYNFERSVLEHRHRPSGYAVLETWSSQLEFCKYFSPKIAVLLNLEPDHLDQHGSWKNYLAAKACLFRQQKKGDVLVFNADCRNTVALIRKFAKPESKKIAFSLRKLAKIHPIGMYLKQDQIIWREGGRDSVLITLPSWPDWGRFFLRNRLAALCVAKALKLNIQSFSKTLNRYTLRPHRHQPVRKIGAIQIINDSKSTNCNAARAALERFSNSSLVWITGGTDKGLPLQSLCRLVKSNVKHTVLLGSFPRLEREMNRAHIPFTIARNLKSAVRQSIRAIGSEGTILFSPIGASDDFFEDYEDRGRKFIQAVRSLR